jgi:small subunit ribosomal protein S8
MLTRIRNAAAVQKASVDVPYSLVKENVVKLLESAGFVENVKVKGDGIGKKIIIELNRNGETAKITEIERVSKPGLRVYCGAEDIPVVKRGRGVVIVSTSKGMMTGDEARKIHVGGELICKVY